METEMKKEQPIKEKEEIKERDGEARRPFINTYNNDKYLLILINKYK
jgi:hypothetical protein